MLFDRWFEFVQFFSSSRYKVTDHNWMRLAKRGDEGDMSGCTAVACTFWGPDEEGELSV